MKKKLFLVFTIMLLSISNMGYSWDWPWVSHVNNWKEKTPQEKAKLYYREVVQGYADDCVKSIDAHMEQESLKRRQCLKLLSGGDYMSWVDHDVIEAADKVFRARLDNYEKKQKFLQAFGVEGLLGLTEFPENVYDKGAILRPFFLRRENAFRSKYQLEDTDMQEIDDELRKQFSGMPKERKETGTFFSPLED